MASNSSLKLLQAAGISTVALAATVLVGVAVITGFKSVRLLENDTSVNDSATLFITGITVFATFMSVIVLALIGKVIVGFFTKK